MFVIFLGIVPTLALVFCCWYCCRDRRQRQQLWAKIQGAPKLSLPYVFLSVLFDKLLTMMRQWFYLGKKKLGLSLETKPSSMASTLFEPVQVDASRAENAQTPIIKIDQRKLETLCSPKRTNDLLLCSDDPQGESKKNKGKGKSKEVRVEIVTIQPEVKSKVKSFGVASERLITERIDISPINSPEVRSASSSPKLMRRIDQTKLSAERLEPGPIRDFRLWVKDQVHLKLPSFSFKRSVSTGSNQSGPSTAESALTEPSSPFHPNNSTAQLCVTSNDQQQDIALPFYSSTQNLLFPIVPAETSTALAKPSHSITKPSLPPPPPPPMPPQSVPSFSFSLD